DRIKRARACISPNVKRLAIALPNPSDPRTVVEDVADRFERHLTGMESGCGGPRAGKVDERQVEIFLERVGPVRPVQPACPPADAGVGVVRPPVEVDGVEGHGAIFELAATVAQTARSACG